MGAAFDHVVLRAAFEGVDPSLPFMVSAPSPPYMHRCRCRRRSCRAVAAVDRIVADVAPDVIVATAAVEYVVASAAVQPIRPAGAVDRVREIRTRQVLDADQVVGVLHLSIEMR